MRILMVGQLAIVRLSARNHAKITKTLHFWVVRLSGFTVLEFDKEPKLSSNHQYFARLIQPSYTLT